jgi:ribosomal protein S3
MATKKKPTPAADQPNLVIGDKSYPIVSLPKDVQDLVSMYERWGKERVEAQIEVNKLDAAQRALATEIAARVQAIEAAPVVEGPSS